MMATLHTFKAADMICFAASFYADAKLYRATIADRATIDAGKVNTMNRHPLLLSLYVGI